MICFEGFKSWRSFLSELSFEWWWCFSSDVSQLVCLRRIYSLATLDQSGLLDSYVNKSFTIGLLWQVSPSWDGRGRVIQKDVISSLSNNQLLNSTFRPLPLTRWAQLADQSSYLTVLGENGHCCTEEEEQLWCWGRGDAAKEHPFAILEHFLQWGKESNWAFSYFTVGKRFGAHRPHIQQASDWLAVVKY